MIEEARGEIQKICDKFPNSAFCAVSSIWFEYRERRYPDAWEICSKVFKNFPKTEEIWELAIRIKMKIGTYEECKKLVDKGVA